MQHFSFIRSIIVFVFIFYSVSIAAEQYARFAYVVNPYDNTVSSYWINKDGQLLPNGMVFTKGKFPVALATNPSQEYLYSVSRTVDTIPIYKIDPVSGWLTETKESQFEAKARSPFNFSFHPSGKFLYAAVRSGFVTGYSVSPTSGALKYIPNTPVASGQRTRNVKVHPSGQFVYAANAYTNNISGYRVNQKTGELTQLPGSPWLSGESGNYEDYKDVYQNLPDVTQGIGGMPYFIAIHPNGKYLYTTNFAAASISIYAIDQASGVLTRLGDPQPTGFAPYAIVFHPNKKYLYVTSWETKDIWGYSVDANSGALTPLTDSPYKETGDKPMAIQFNPQGDKAYVTSSWSNAINVFNVDVQTGKFLLHDITLSRAGAIDITIISGKESVKVKPSTAFITNPRDKQLIGYQVDINSGDLIARSRTKTGNFPVALASDPRNRFLYLADYEDNTISTFNVDTKSGNLTEITDSPYEISDRPVSIAVDANGWYLYILNQGSEKLASYLIHVRSGQLAEAAESPVSVGHGPTQLSIDPFVRSTLVLNQSDKSISGYRYQTSIHANLQEMTALGSPIQFKSIPSHVAIEPLGRFAVVVDQSENQLGVYKLLVTGGYFDTKSKIEYKTAKSPLNAVFHPFGTYLYVLHQSPALITTYKINRLTTELAKVDQTDELDSRPKKVIVDPSGSYIYVLPEQGNILVKYDIDASSGKLKNKREIDLKFNPSDMVIYREFE